MTKNLLVVGAGHAAGQVATSLRAGGYDGRIMLIGDEPYMPYERPPLSKQFLAGDMDLERTYFRPAEFYEKSGIELRLGSRVQNLDRGRREVTLEGDTALGEDTVLPYNQLILTTGARVRRLNLPGSDLEGLHYLRHIDDVRAIRADFEPGRRLVIVGGGYIGLEVAAVARQLGLEVTLLEMAPRLMSRVVAPEVAEFFESVHREHGVDIQTGVTVEGFSGSGRSDGDRVERVLRGHGEHVEADIVVIGVGVLPNVELAAAAGLECATPEEGGGIRVDENAQTTDPDIFAAGDCTHHPNELLGRSLRLESVANAIEQAKTAAAAICGKPRPYRQVPWFWSDQYDLKLQIAGLSSGSDQVVLRGDPASRSFAACYLKEGILIAVDAINSPRDFMASRKLLASKPRISPQRLADTDVPLKDMPATDIS